MAIEQIHPVGGERWTTAIRVITFRSARRRWSRDDQVVGIGGHAHTEKASRARFFPSRFSLTCDSPLWVVLTCGPTQPAAENREPSLPLGVIPGERSARFDDRSDLRLSQFRVMGPVGLQADRESWPLLGFHGRGFLVRQQVQHRLDRELDERVIRGRDAAVGHCVLEPDDRLADAVHRERPGAEGFGHPEVLHVRPALVPFPEAVFQVPGHRHAVQMQLLRLLHPQSRADEWMAWGLAHAWFATLQARQIEDHRQGSWVLVRHHAKSLAIVKTQGWIGTRDT